MLGIFYLCSDGLEMAQWETQLMALDNKVLGQAKNLAWEGPCDRLNDAQIKSAHI
jgi:hypothetical protein